MSADLQQQHDSGNDVRLTVSSRACHSRGTCSQGGLAGARRACGSHTIMRCRFFNWMHAVIPVLLAGFFAAS